VDNDSNEMMGPLRGPSPAMRLPLSIADHHGTIFNRNDAVENQELW